MKDVELEREIKRIDNAWVEYWKKAYKNNPGLYEEMHPKLFSKDWFWLKGRRLGLW